MTIEQKREYVMNAYPGPKWKRRCSYMEPRQICAIFERLLMTGTLNSKKSPELAGKWPHQMTLFEYYGSEILL